MISVITAYYNSHDFIGKAYDSLKAQSLDSWEWIIVDDGSQAESLVALRAMIEGDERVKVLTQENAGQGAARNLGAKEAKGQFLCFLDSDDWFDDRKLEKQLDHMKEKDWDLSFTEVQGIRQDGCDYEFSGACYFDQKRGRELLPDLIYECFFTLSSVMMTKRCFVELGGFSPYEQFRGTEDFELWVRAAAADKSFGCVREPLTYYNIRHDSEVRDVIRSCDGVLHSIRFVKNDSDEQVKKAARRRSLMLARRLILRATASNKTEIARYWAAEEPRALFGTANILFAAGGWPVVKLLKLAYWIKERVK